MCLPWPGLPAVHDFLNAQDIRVVRFDRDQSASSAHPFLVDLGFIPIHASINQTAYNPTSHRTDAGSRQGRGEPSGRD